MEKSNEYMQIYKQYSEKSDDELYQIINSSGEYRDIAKQVANDILQSDRTIYNQEVKDRNDSYISEQNKAKLTENHPLYNDIHQIAGDIRFIKNLIVVGIAVTLCLSIISVLITI